MKVTLVPIRAALADNQRFLSVPECQEILEMSVTYYLNIGYVPPWIGYFAQLDDAFVGSGGFKGKPVNRGVEIAYGTFEPYRNRGVGSAICRALTDLARSTDPDVRVTARTLPEENYSAQILRRNGFVLLGHVMDKDDGDVWEWEYRLAGDGD